MRFGHLYDWSSIILSFNRGQTRSMPMTRDDYTITPDKCIPELPAGIATVIERATYYEPADRIPIGELISDLTEISDNLLRLPEAIEPPGDIEKVMDSSTTPVETMKLLQDFTETKSFIDGAGRSVQGRNNYQRHSMKPKRQRSKQKLKN